MNGLFEYSRFTVLQSRPGAGDAPLCRLVVGVPASALIDLVSKYPNHAVDGRRSPKVAKAIEAQLPEQEAAIRGYFVEKGDPIPPSAKIKFQPEVSGPASAEYEGKSPDFVSGDGKQFWIEWLLRG
jgi:hypothetical protein